MSPDSRYLNLRQAAQYICQSPRFLRRHWPDLLRDGVKVLRIPANLGPKGRLFFDRASLDAYLEKCRIQADFGAV